MNHADNPEEVRPVPGDAPDTRHAHSLLADQGRRRLMRGAAGSAGVLLAVQARTALAGGSRGGDGGGTCQSPSAMMSGNVSPRAGDGSTCSGGRSPGYWVQPQHFGAWVDAGAQPPTFSPALVECASGVGGLALTAIATPGTRFIDVFGNALALKSSLEDEVTAEQASSLWAVIYKPSAFQTAGNVSGQVARHLACAWLNASYFAWSDAQYPITTAQVKDMFDQLLVGEYCPTSTNCSGGGMSAEDVKAYIEGMYDLNAPVPNYCKES